MDGHEIAKLRQDQRLQAMPGGGEGVPVSIQYKGLVPPLSRNERKQWLVSRFSRIEDKLSHLGLHFDPQTVSVSGQTVEGQCAVDCLEQVQKNVHPEEYEVKLVKKAQVTTGG